MEEAVCWRENSLTLAPIPQVSESSGSHWAPADRASTSVVQLLGQLSSLLCSAHPRTPTPPSVSEQEGPPRIPHALLVTPQGQPGATPGRMPCPPKHQGQGRFCSDPPDSLLRELAFVFIFLVEKHNVTNQRVVKEISKRQEQTHPLLKGCKECRERRELQNKYN